MGAYGSKLPASPRLDELASESVVFERAWSSASWTRPSLPSLLTGLYPSEHGLDDQFWLTGDKVAAQALPLEAETIAELLAAKGYRTALFGEQAQLSRSFQLDQGFTEYRVRQGAAASIRDRFATWLAEAKTEPFFAYLHFLDLHWPYCPRVAFGAFDAAPDSRNFCGNWRELRNRLASGEEILSERDQRALRARYAEQLLELDAELGRMFDQMKASGRWDETLIILTADHGEELYERGAARHGHTMFEELLHVPYVWKLPKSWRAAGGRRVSGLVETRSLAPTLFDAVGAPTPERVSAPSLLPWLLGRETQRAPAELAVAESNGLYALRDARFKLIVDAGKKSTQLYDLVADPGETRDLAAKEPERVEEMRRRLREWRSKLKPLPRGGGRQIDAATTEELRALGYIL